MIAFAVASGGSTAKAQWGYPGGFGPFGWEGWGATTALGDEARGMGVFAAGLGQYNLSTAQAQAINADTVMRFNEYLWESQRLRNQRYMQQLADRRERINESARLVYTRLSTNPERRDIHRGDALNVLLDQLTAPGVYSRSIKAAQAPLASTLVKTIPFRYNPQAITISLDELANRVPPILSDARFATEKDAFKQAAAKARAEAETQEEMSRATLGEVQGAARALREKVRSTLPAGRERTQAENFLKAATGLARMMESPEIGAFLKDLDRTDATSLAALIGFMQTFNLRFGVASAPPQRTAYDELFTRLRAVRDQLFAGMEAPDAIQAPETLHPEYAESFFGSMEDQDLEEKKPLTPAPAPARP